MKRRPPNGSTVEPHPHGSAEVEVEQPRMWSDAVRPLGLAVIPADVGAPPGSAASAGTADPSCPLDSTSLTCPSCRGRGWWIVKRAAYPYRLRSCTICDGGKKIELAWVSSAALPGVRHVARADRAPHHLCLCGWTIVTSDIVEPQGLLCTGCIHVLRQLDLTMDLTLAKEDRNRSDPDHK